MKRLDILSTLKGAGIGLGFIALSLVLVLVGYNVLAPNSSAEASTNPDTILTNTTTATPVLVQPIQIESSIEVPRYFLGQVEAQQTAELGFELGGKLIQVDVEEGDFVVEGQLLAAIDTQIIRAEQDRLLALQEAVTGQLVFAKEAFERSDSLLRRGLGNAVQHDQARRSQSELENSLIEIEANLHTAEIRMDKSALRAPFAGVIGARLSDPGENIAAGQPMLSIFGQESLNFRIGLPPQIDPIILQNPQIEIDGDIIDASLTTVRKDIDPVTRTQTVIYKLNNPPAGLSIGRPGTFVASIKLDLTGAWVPISSMRADVSGVWTVLTVGADSKVKTVAVEVLYLGDDKAYVFGAFDAGENVIVGGAHKVTVGQTVKVD